MIVSTAKLVMEFCDTSYEKCLGLFVFADSGICAVGAPKADGDVCKYPRVEGNSTEDRSMTTVFIAMVVPRCW